MEAREEPGLPRRCTSLGGRARRGSTPLGRCAANSDAASSNASSRVPYLYPDFDDDTSETEENAAIEAGAVNANGFRYVGILALEGEHFHTR